MKQTTLIKGGEVMVVPSETVPHWAAYGWAEGRLSGPKVMTPPKTTTKTTTSTKTTSTEG